MTTPTTKQKIYVASNYTFTDYHCVELPSNIQFSDIKDWYVKWGNFYYTLDGKDYVEVPNKGPGNWEGTLDMKRPASTVIYDATPTGEIGNTELAEHW